MTATPSVPKLSSARVLVVSNGLAGLSLAVAWAATASELRAENQMGWLTFGIAVVVVGGLGNAGFLVRRRREVVRDRRAMQAVLTSRRSARRVVAGTGTGTGGGPVVTTPTMTRFHHPGCQLVRGKAAEEFAAPGDMSASRLACGVCRSEQPRPGSAGEGAAGRLTLEGVTAGYGDTVVLRDIDLVVPAGAVVALIGLNGAGKTSLLRVVAGLLPPLTGRITFDGDELTHAPAHVVVSQGVHLIPEGRGIFPPLTVRENLRLFTGPVRHAESLEFVVDAFPHLGQRLDQEAGTMSGGEQQMLALARAYLRKPRLVLLDELSTGLAPKVVDEIFAVIERFRAQGMSILVVEQYVNKVLPIADYVFSLRRGELAFSGEPSELINEDVFAEFV